MRTKVWSENLKRRDNSEDPRVYGRIALEWILGKQGGKGGPVVGCCEYHKEPLGTIKGGGFFWPAE